jgi:hypothetical protein
VNAVNYLSLTEGACCCPGFVDQDATMGWLTLVANLRVLVAISRLGSLISAEGLTHLSPLLKENMPLKPLSSYEQSNLTVLLFKRVPYHFRCG